MSDIGTGDLETTGALAIGALMLGFIASLFQNGEAPLEEPLPEEPPETGAVGITAASWETAAYDFNSVWGDQLTATFYRGEIEVTSESGFSGQIVLACPYTIAPVPLLSQAGYQTMLAELDELIANSTGQIQQLWQDRKAIALGFPQVDGFYIDYRWWSDQEGKFREWIDEGIDYITWEGIDIPAGSSTVTVGFFKQQWVGIGYPLMVSLYDTVGNLLASTEAELPGAEESPSAQGLLLPPQVAPGEDFQAQLTIRIPEALPGHQETFVNLQLETGMGTHDLAGRTLLSAGIANALNDHYGESLFIPLDSPDDMYELDYDCQALLRIFEGPNRGWREITLSPGQYPIHVKTETWRVSISSSGGGLYIYGNEPYEVTRFYNVATLNVI